MTNSLRVKVLQLYFYPIHLQFDFSGNVNSHNNCLIDMSNNSGGNISPTAMSGGSPGIYLLIFKKNIKVSNFCLLLGSPSQCSSLGGHSGMHVTDINNQHGKDLFVSV